MVDEAKEKEEAEYLNRFRQHMCKIVSNIQLTVLNFVDWLEVCDTKGD